MKAKGRSRASARVTLTLSPGSLVDVLRWRASHQPHRRAYTFLVDGELQEASRTYAEVDRAARAIAVLLAGAAARGERALLLYPPGLEFIEAFLGCLCADVVAIPAYPPHPARLDRTLRTLRAIAEDARPAVVLTTAAIRAGAQKWMADDPIFQRMSWFSTDDRSFDDADQWRDPQTPESSLAFIQYTSGSTAAPKGVMVSHANLLYNSFLIYDRFEHTAESQGVIWLPPYHDMGLIGGILQPLHAGFAVTLMSPLSFLQRPVRWLRAITRHRGTTSGGPNFAYDLCVQKIPVEQRDGLDLSSWDVAFTGAEPIRAETIERFVEAFAPCGFRPRAFYPCYGLAETTLMAAGGAKAELPITLRLDRAALANHVVSPPAGAESTVVVGCGQPPPDQAIRIVDPQQLTRCERGRVGEIWVAGPGVAQGYWNRPEETRSTFGARIAGSSDGPFLRTGDLGFLHNGDLFVTGRLKDVIIVDGQNHYPSDIELTVEQCHAALRPGCTAAVPVDTGAGEGIVIIAEVDRRLRSELRSQAAATNTAATDTAPTNTAPTNTGSIVKAIRQAVSSEHRLRVEAVCLLLPGELPKTSSGKVQRHLCRSAFLSGALTPAAE